MRNHVSDQLKQEFSAVHLVSEFITCLQRSDSDQETYMDEHPEKTHHVINKTIEEFECYHPAPLRNLIEGKDEQIATLHVASALEPYTGSDISSNEDMHYAQGVLS